MFDPVDRSEEALRLYAQLLMKVLENTDIAHLWRVIIEKVSPDLEAQILPFYALSNGEEDRKTTAFDKQVGEGGKKLRKLARNAIFQLPESAELENNSNAIRQYWTGFRLSFTIILTRRTHETNPAFVALHAHWQETRARTFAETNLCI